MRIHRPIRLHSHRDAKEGAVFMKPDRAHILVAALRRRDAKEGGVFMKPCAAHPRRARWRTVAILLIGVLGTGGSLCLFFGVWEVQQRQAQGEFRQRAMAGATAIQRSVQEHLEVLYG